MYFFAINKLIVMVDVYILLITKNGEVTKEGNEHSNACVCVKGVNVKGGTIKKIRNYSICFLFKWIEN